MTPASEIRPAPLPRPWLQGRVQLPRPALGDLYRRRGVAWGKLIERHHHRIPDGWRESERQERKL